MSGANKRKKHKDDSLELAHTYIEGGADRSSKVHSASRVLHLGETAGDKTDKLFGASNASPPATATNQQQQNTFTIGVAGPNIPILNSDALGPFNYVSYGVRNSPLSLAINSPALLGSSQASFANAAPGYPTSYQAVNIFYKSTGNRYYAWAYDGYSSWNQAVSDAYNAFAADPNNGLFKIAVSSDPNASGYSDSIAVTGAINNYAKKIIESKGIFNSLTPGATNGFVIDKRGLSYSNRAGVTSGNSVWVGFYPYFYTSPSDFSPYKIFQNLINDYNKLVGQSPTGLLDFSLNNFDNTITLGPISGADLRLGNGNNIIISSPALYAASWDAIGSGGFTNIYGVTTNIFYPSAQGIFQSNTITLGNGNNLIYYDSSDRMVRSGNGNNTFLPSFGSFNWGFTGWPNNQKFDNSSSGQKNILAPIPITNYGQNYTVDDAYAIVDSYGDSRGGRDLKAQTVYTGLKAFQSNTTANNLGGETLVAGSGDDTFYGIDPSFYDYNSTTGTGIPVKDGTYRYVTLLQGQAADPSASSIRYYNQTYTTVSMWGGGGNNTFNLGDPTALNIDGLNYNGAYSYILGLSHDPSFASNGYLLTDADRSNLDFGNKISGVNSVNINLSTNVNKYTNISQSFDSKTGKSVAGLDWAKTGIGLANGAQKFFDKVIGVTALGKKFFPYLDTGLAITGSVVDVLKNIFGTVAADPQPITVKDTAYSQPLASWRHAIDVTDWNPQTLLNITVDAIGADNLTANQKANARWANTEFSISNPVTSNNDTGVSIGWRNSTTQTIISPLFQLSGFGNDNYGYYSYNFVTNSNVGGYQKIGKDNIAFIGQINQNLAPLQGYVASNGFNFSNTSYNKSPVMNSGGSYQFFWSDIYQNISDTRKIFNNGTLTAADILNSVSNISVRFNTMSLGYYWDTQFTSDGSLKNLSTANVTQDQLTNAVSVDSAKSKLWVESITGNGAVWNFFTYDQFTHTTLALADALRAKTYYSVNSEIDQNEKTNQRIASGLVSLNTYMTDLNQLQQSAVTTNPKLTSLGQITHVAEVKGGEFPGGGVDVYYMPDASRSEVYKTFITSNNGVPTASDPTKLTNQEIASFINQGIDINLSENVIASLNPNANSPVTVLTGATNVSGSADMYKLASNDNAALYLGSAEEEYLLTSSHGYFGKSEFHLASNGFDLGSPLSAEHEGVYQFQDPLNNDIIFSTLENDKSSVAIPGNYINEGFAFWAQEAEGGDSGAQKMFSLLDNATGAHAYTTSQDLAAQLTNSGHFTNQGAQFAV